MSITRNGKRYMLYRRVPARYASVDRRTFVKVSLKTDSLEVAQTKAPAVWRALLDGWEAKLKGRDADADRAFEAAKELAAARGFTYLPLAQVATLPIGELVERVEAVAAHTPKGEPVDRVEAAAVLGGAVAPAITLTGGLDDYWKLTRDQIAGKSEDQLRRWRNPRIKAVKNLVAVVGDKPIADLSGDDMLDFRTWWVERIEAEDLTPNSANKDLVHIGSVLRTVNKMKRLGLVLPLSDLALKEGEKAKRPPFSTSWIKDRLLAPGALDGLNDEARAILLTMVNTGCRPSEIACLTAGQIHLGDAVPHISIEPIGRQLKSARARRKIALVGVSFEAMKAFPGGFPRYAKSSASLSATVNKFLRQNGLLETDRHVLYSLRHSFEDRLLAAGVDERVRRDLMGHRLTREEYGAGASLDHMRRLLLPVAL